MSNQILIQWANNNVTIIIVVLIVLYNNSNIVYCTSKNKSCDIKDFSYYLSFISCYQPYAQFMSSVGTKRLGVADSIENY